MLTSDEHKLLRNFQDSLGELIDQYLKLGAEPDWLREVMQQEIVSDLESRRIELEQA